MTIKIKTWTCVLNWDNGKLGNDYYKFNSTNWDVSDEELSLCINEQIYGDLLRKAKEGEGK